MIRSLSLIGVASASIIRMQAFDASSPAVVQQRRAAAAEAAGDAGSVLDFHDKIEEQ